MRICKLDDETYILVASTIAGLNLFLGLDVRAHGAAQISHALIDDAV